MISNLNLENLLVFRIKLITRKLFIIDSDYLLQNKRIVLNIDEVIQSVLLERNLQTEFLLYVLVTDFIRQ